MGFIPFGIKVFTVANFLGTINHIEHITKTYFSGESLLFIYWSNVSMEFGDELMNYWMKSEIVIVETCNCDYVTDDIIWKRSYVKNIVILFGDLVPEGRHVEKIRQCESWNSRSKILVIVNSDDVVDETLEKIWTLTKAINVTVMVSKMSSVKYYTSYPYDNFKVVELDQNGLFPIKPLNDLNGSVIAAAAVLSEPYVLIPESPDEYTEGLEIRIVNTLAKLYNFKIKYVQPPNGESAWIALANNKVVGNLGLVYRCEADLLFHGVQVRYDRALLADCTCVHTIDNMVWVVPVRPYTFNWRSIFIVFQKELWELLLIFLILITMTLYLIVKYEFGSPKTSYNIFDAFFQSFGMYLYVPIHFYRKGHLYRFFIFIVSCFNIIIVSSYQSSLITHLTTPGRQNQIDTIEEAVDEGLIGTFYPSARPAFNITDHDLWNKILTPGRHFFSENGSFMLNLVAYNKTVYVLTISTFYEFIVHKDLLDEDHEPMVRILPKFFIPYLVTIFTSKGHPLNDLINKKVLQMVEAGIIDYWLEDIILSNSHSKEGFDVHSDEGPVALTIKQLRGAFYLLSVFSIIACGVLVFEVVFHRWKIRKIRESLL